MICRRYWYILFVLWSTALLFGSDEIIIRPGGSDHFEVQPGQTVTAIFHVTNKTASPQDLIGSVKLPEKWKLITSEYPFTLESEESDLRLLSIYVPNDVSAGIYDITYRIRGRERPSISDEYSITVRVASYKKLEISIINAPEYVFAGSPYSVTYLVANRSNMDARINFSIKLKENYPIRITPSSALIEKGHTKKVSVTIKTDSTLEVNLSQKVRFYASILSDPDVKTMTIRNVEIVPIGTKKKSGYHLYPVKVGVSHGMQRNYRERSGTQFSIEGEGILKDGTDKYLKFKLKGPDAYGKSIFFEHEEYFAFFRTSRYSVHIGDKNFTLTPLLEHFRYGRGIEGSVKKGKFVAGGYAFMTRWLRPNETQKAVYANYSPIKGAVVGLNLLNKTGRVRHGTLFSLVAKLDRFKGTNIETEFAVGEKKKSYQIRLTSRWPSLFYSLNIIAADKDFPGYYTDTRFFTTSLSYNINDNLQVLANYRQEHQNFEIDTTKYSAPFSKYGKFGIAYRAGKRAKIFTDIVFRSRRDRMPVPLFSYRETSGRLGAWYQIGPFSISGSIEAGKTLNDLIDSLVVMYRYMSSIYFRPADNFSARGYFYMNLNNRYSMDREKRITYGINLRYKAADRTLFILNYQNNYSREEYYRNRDLFEARLEHTMLNGHVFSARARYTLVRNTLDMRETALLFSYQIPLSVPLGKKHNLGLVKGKIYNAEDGRALPEVIIRMGNVVTVSNKNGYFSFPPCTPGKYLLSIDRVNLGLNAITVQKVPQKIDVYGGQEVLVNLGITKSASLSGRIVLFTSTPETLQKKNRGEKIVIDETKLETGLSDKLYPSKGVSGVIVELKKDKEIKRWFSDKNGYFKFSDLRPGLWEVKVLDTNIPQNFRLEKNVFKIDLKPLDIQDIAVRVIPKKRKIKIIQQGGTLLEEKKDN